MLVKDIIKKVVNYTNNFDLFKAVESGTFTEEQTKEINLLVDCVNLTNSNIAANYVKLYDTKSLKVRDGLIPFSELSAQTIYDIVSVKDVNGRTVDFDILNNGLSVKVKEAIVKFTYFPEDVKYEDELTNFKIKINERIFVYGVISEYLYVKGVFDEAEIWEEKFKNELKNCLRTVKSHRTAKRRWF